MNLMYAVCDPTKKYPGTIVENGVFGVVHGDPGTWYVVFAEAGGVQIGRINPSEAATYLAQGCRAGGFFEIPATALAVKCEWSQVFEPYDIAADLGLPLCVGLEGELADKIHDIFSVAAINENRINKEAVFQWAAESDYENLIKNPAKLMVLVALLLNAPHLDGVRAEVAEGDILLFGGSLRALLAKFRGHAKGLVIRSLSRSSRFWKGVLQSWSVREVVQEIERGIGCRIGPTDITCPGGVSLPSRFRLPDDLSQINEKIVQDVVNNLLDNIFSDPPLLGVKALDEGGVTFSLEIGMEPAHSTVAILGAALSTADAVSVRVTQKDSFGWEAVFKIPYKNLRQFLDTALEIYRSGVLERLDTHAEVFMLLFTDTSGLREEDKKDLKNAIKELLTAWEAGGGVALLTPDQVRLLVKHTVGIHWRLSQHDEFGSVYELIREIKRAYTISERLKIKHGVSARVPA